MKPLHLIVVAGVLVVIGWLAFKKPATTLPIEQANSTYVPNVPVQVNPATGNEVRVYTSSTGKTYDINTLTADRASLQNQYDAAYLQWIAPVDSAIKRLGQMIQSGGYRGDTLNTMIAQERTMQAQLEQLMLTVLGPIQTQINALKNLR